MGFLSRRGRKAQEQENQTQVESAPSSELKQGITPNQQQVSWRPGEPRGWATSAVSPSVPGQLPVDAREDDRQNEARLYRAGHDAANRGERPEAIRYFERVVGAYQGYESDKRQFSWALAVTLEALAKLASEEPAAALIRYRQAAEIYSRVAAECAGKGDRDGAVKARAGAEKAFREAEKADKRWTDNKKRTAAFIGDVDRVNRWPRPRGG